MVMMLLIPPTAGGGDMGGGGGGTWKGRVASLCPFWYMFDGRPSVVLGTRIGCGRRGRMARRGYRGRPG